jgi:hypothetical protein
MLELLAEDRGRSWESDRLALKRLLLRASDGGMGGVDGCRRGCVGEKARLGSGSTKPGATGTVVATGSSGSVPRGAGRLPRPSGGGGAARWSEAPNSVGGGCGPTGTSAGGTPAPCGSGSAAPSSSGVCGGSASAAMDDANAGCGGDTCGSPSGEPSSALAPVALPAAGGNGYSNRATTSKGVPSRIALGECSVTPGGTDAWRALVSRSDAPGPGRRTWICGPGGSAGARAGTAPAGDVARTGGPGGACSSSSDAIVGGGH